MAKIQEHDGSAKIATRPPTFVDGYFSSRIKAGDNPRQGYPKNHLPDVGDASMEVVTGFAE